MKHRVLFLTALAAAGILLLTACTSSEDEIARSARTESLGDAGSGDAGSADGTAVQPDVSQDAGADAVTAGDSGTQAQSGAANEDGSSQTGDGAATGGQTEAGAPTEVQTEKGITEEIPTEVPQDGAAEPVPEEDIWSGTYVGDEETVTITLADSGSFSFAFANSGIASVAEIDGTTAVYRGDDHHVVTFEMDEGVLNITVSSEEDFDASASPLNGMYVRQQ